MAGRKYPNGVSRTHSSLSWIVQRPKRWLQKFRSPHDRVPNWASTEWGRLLTDPSTRDISTKQGRLFRRRFRIPFPFFIDWLVPAFREHNIFEVPSNKCCPVMPCRKKPERFLVTQASSAQHTSHKKIFLWEVCWALLACVTRNRSGFFLQGITGQHLLDGTSKMLCSLKAGTNQSMKKGKGIRKRLRNNRPCLVEMSLVEGSVSKRPHSVDAQLGTRSCGDLNFCNHLLGRCTIQERDECVLETPLGYFLPAKRRRLY